MHEKGAEGWAVFTLAHKVAVDSAALTASPRVNESLQDVAAECLCVRERVRCVWVRAGW
jgi:hypothetical protein